MKVPLYRRHLLVHDNDSNSVGSSKLIFSIFTLWPILILISKNSPPPPPPFHKRIFFLPVCAAPIFILRLTVFLYFHPFVYTYRFIFLMCFLFSSIFSLFYFPELFSGGGEHIKNVHCFHTFGGSSRKSVSTVLMHSKPADQLRDVWTCCQGPRGSFTSCTCARHLALDDKST